MAPVGRWQQGRDLNWYAKGDDESKAAEAERIKEEKRKLKEAEEDAMLAAMGLPVPERAKDNANLEPLGKKAHEADVNEAMEKKVKDGEDEDKAGRKEKKERSRRHRDDDRDRKRRHRSRSRSRDRATDAVTTTRTIDAGTVRGAASIGAVMTALSVEESKGQVTSVRDHVRETDSANEIQGAGRRTRNLREGKTEGPCCSHSSNETAYMKSPTMSMQHCA
jgi:hypothetical protein